MAKSIFLLLTPAKPNCAISTQAANYEQLLLWQLAKKQILTFNCWTSDHYSSWALGMCPSQKTDFAGFIPPLTANFGGQ